jgi:hypothetical protein
MLKIRLIKTALVVVCLAITGMITACSPSATSSLPEPSYSEAMTENILKAINENDYALFSRDFDQTMKQAMSQQAFDQVKTTLLNKVGAYVSGSLEFNQTALQGEYTTVIYTAKFTNEPENVTVTITFRTVEENNLVSGLYFNSPKLRG